jgi:hypothetical protein
MYKYGNSAGERIALYQKWNIFFNISILFTKMYKIEMYQKGNL